MHRYSVSAMLFSLIFIGAGCMPSLAPTDLPSTPPEEAMTEDEGADTEVTMPEDGGATAESPEPFYIAYSSDEYAKAKAAKRPVLLYFWASWCPICRAEEPKLRAAVEGSGLPVAGFRVDFDVQDDLKKEFRVPYQHTTVILDVNGAESARFTGPVPEAELLAALRAAAGN